MLKRRNSPYASHERRLPTRVVNNAKPRILDPPPLHPRQRFPATNI